MSKTLEIRRGQEAPMENDPGQKTEQGDKATVDDDR